MMYIYILKLENNKYYVGKSEVPDIRIANQFSNNGSSFTKKYKPIDVINIIQTDDPFDEDKETFKMMEKYGINNVRGGSFCEITLSEESMITLKRMISGSTNKCFICGSLEHFVNDCNEKSDDIEDEIENEKLIKILKKEDKCFICQREGHYESECYAKTYVNG
jgi:predicted GIY-YIG superfamily endonuclease